MPQNKIFIFGLDRAGKTVMTNYFCTGVVEEKQRPTLNFSPKTLVLKKLRSTLWDAPGQSKFRSMWLKNVARSKALVYVVDMSAQERYDESYKELNDFLGKIPSTEAPLILLLNKMDVDGAKQQIETVKSLFSISEIFPNPIHIRETTIRDTTTLDEVKGLLEEILGE
jgi:small GTP-binding protein